MIKIFDQDNDQAYARRSKFWKFFENLKILILLALGFPQSVLEFKKELF